MEQQPQDETPLEVMESQVFGLEIEEKDMLETKPEMPKKRI